ncbi:IS1380 family transposase [Microtetraspora malaysiensis]|uniref:IS1380 family transposase n=1 Tax=Microtetraspora malaysiensis TaxID=161358 RepID=A0ABW6SYR0_9ACTN
MRLFHAAARTHARFDDEHVIAYAGLEPVMRLAERCDLGGLINKHVAIADRLGVNAAAKISSIVAGMAAGADSIADLDALRHGMDTLFDGIRAPSTLGSFLRCLNWGNVRQIEKVSRESVVRLATHAPLLPAADTVAFLDVDSMQKRTYGYAKQGAGFGHTKFQGKSVLVRGLNVLASTLSTPLAAPVITGTRLRGGKAGSARGAESFVAESITAARAAGATGILLVRGDSAFYTAAVIAACRRAGARFSVTAKMDPKIKAAIAAIDDDAWQAIEYPNAIFDEQAGCWVSDAEIVETCCTAFTSKKGQAVTARLIVRRVKRLNPQAAGGQDELFSNSGITLSSPTARSTWCRPKNSIVTTRSSSRSSPTCPAARSRIFPRSPLPPPRPPRLPAPPAHEPPLPSPADMWPGCDPREATLSCPETALHLMKRSSRPNWTRNRSQEITGWIQAQYRSQRPLPEKFR